jgi:hypothetical protein
MSPRAAWRLETLGFSDVSDYVAGKSDWLGAGLPVEGTAASAVRVADLADGEVPRCALGETVGQVRDRLRRGAPCVVVAGEDVVLGLVREKDLDADDDWQVERVMVEGPSTVRPYVPAGELAGRLAESGFRSYLVTTAGGQLVGLLRGEDLERWYHEHGGGSAAEP